MARVEHFVCSACNQPKSGLAAVGIPKIPRVCSGCQAKLDDAERTAHLEIHKELSIEERLAKIAGGVAETVRQGMGKIAGIPQDINKGDVALSMGTGLLGPMLFGTGAGAKQIIKHATKKGTVLTKEALEAALKKQKGAMERGAGFIKGNFFTKAGETLSGVDSEILSTYAKHLDKIDAMSKEDAKGDGL